MALMWGLSHITHNKKQAKPEKQTANDWPRSSRAAWVGLRLRGKVA